MTLLKIDVTSGHSNVTRVNDLSPIERDLISKISVDQNQTKQPANAASSLRPFRGMKCDEVNVIHTPTAKHAEDRRRASYGRPLPARNRASRGKASLPDEVGEALRTCGESVPAVPPTTGQIYTWTVPGTSRIGSVGGALSRFERSHRMGGRRGYPAARPTGPRPA